MTVATPRAHWLVGIARSQQLLGADSLMLPANATVQDAWRVTARSAGITQAKLAERVAAASHLALADLTKAEASALTLLPERLARHHLLFPLRQTNAQLVVATSDPSDLEAEQLISFAAGRRTVLEVAPPGVIHEAIDANYSTERALDRLLSRAGVEVAGSVEVLDEGEPIRLSERAAESAPIILLAHLILADAVHARASDIHFEPAADGGRVRFRVDGVLQPYTALPAAVLNRVVSRLKIIGKMDIADHLRPQDGRARIKVDERSIDLRISTVPTRDAEKAVIRLLDPGKALRLEDLSLTTAELVPLRSLLGRRDGIVLVTGPTGSGKTTLLYAALREMPTGELNIMTVEDPIEYELSGLTQIQVEPKRDVTFATALKSILRQDPDVIFIGEIRDQETAAIAVQSSLTGHLVLASLHTNDAVGSIARFADLGVDRGEIASTFRGATAQRLIRRICKSCAQRITGDLSETESQLAMRYGVAPVVRAIGCAACGQTGYFGRIPLLEVLLASPALEAAILSGTSTSALQRVAVASGMRPLRAAAVARVRDGETTLEEVDRELGEADNAPVAPGEEPRDTASDGAVRPAVAPSLPRVVLVEDDDVSRAIAHALLTRNGYRVSEAVDGASALEVIAHAAGDVALVVLDLGLPVVSGQEVLRRLRSAPATATLPVLVLTGATEAGTEVEMMEAGADDYVRKPLEPERFVARVRAVLKRAALSRG